VLLTWPTNYLGFDYTGFGLQTTTNFSASPPWKSISSLRVILNGQNTVTNPIAGTRQFFRLSE
jgi:hypothetical protein